MQWCGYLIIPVRSTGIVISSRNKNIGTSVNGGLVQYALWWHKREALK